MKSWAMDIEIAAKKEGFEKGIAKGIEKKLLDMTKRIMNAKGKTLDEAMVLLELTEDEKKFVRLHLTESDEAS